MDYLLASQQACSSATSPLAIHAQLGHLGLPVLQKLVPSLSKLSSFHCELCQLGTHTCQSFPNCVN